jgi:DnaJ-class molecular chaperone
MSAISLPPDPYVALGVSKDAQLPEIRSAHRKLVVKCPPYKVQDAALKALKQVEFEKVQRAHEILLDDVRRAQYDDQVKLAELRKEMGERLSLAAILSNMTFGRPNLGGLLFMEGSMQYRMCLMM